MTQASELVIVPALIDKRRLLLTQPDLHDLTDDDMVCCDHPSIADPAVEGDKARHQGWRTRLEILPLPNAKALLPLKAGPPGKDIGKLDIDSSERIHAENPV